MPRGEVVCAKESRFSRSTSLNLAAVRTKSFRQAQQNMDFDELVVLLRGPLAHRRDLAGPGSYP